VLKSAQ
jgi:hypothetical protein